LALRRDLLENLLDRPDEAHVEHLIGLVEHQDLSAGEHDIALVHMVDQPARRSDEHIDAIARGSDLRPMRNTAIHRSDRDAHMPAIGPETLGDLGRQFSCRREDQHARALAQRRTAVRGEPVQDRQSESGGLAGAGLGDAEKVLAGEHIGDRLGLDRGRDRIAFVGKRLQKGRTEPEFIKVRQSLILSKKWP